ncbi:hypothetical protein RA19_18580 [Leisingera sp. ANG-M1]|uniref:TetR/AcrR family transcriptional regulator n=1 Tax=Leisingera sp. ANG-M1 TaxID=1577895 RepID=UPI00058011AD|nr:TetR/AcrR family transcriptional regulator [Leisingera sp. ANG-M1]KIC08901.1 hypothetical protein RA19_18580 [Leisingera sp. ANG-M1]
MARYKKLDLDDLLDAAYEVIISKGAHALSIGNVAKAAGVTKGGIQSNFGTKEALIDALFERWSDDLEAETSELQSSETEPSDPLSLFLLATRKLHSRKPRQNAAMMFLMSQNVEHREAARNWIAEKIDRFNLSGEQARQARLRFIVLESLITMQSMELTTFDSMEWEEIFEDVERLFSVEAPAR